MECKFYSGQKVVCVWDKWCRLDNGRPLDAKFLPRTDAEYTVEAVGAEGDFVFVRLIELPGGQFDHRGFKPLDDRKTDISVFLEALTPVRKKAEKVA